MGGETSKEVRLAASPEASAEVANQAVRSAAEYEKHVANLKEIEAALFKEGYKAGHDDAVAGLDDQIKLQTKAAYAEQVLSEEQFRVAQLASEVSELERRHARQPLRALECRAEEEAFLACKPTADNGMCAAPVREYVQCADRVTFRLMNPSSQGAKLR